MIHRSLQKLGDDSKKKRPLVSTGCPICFGAYVSFVFNTASYAWTTTLKQYHGMLCYLVYVSKFYFCLLGSCGPYLVIAQYEPDFIIN